MKKFLLNRALAAKEKITFFVLLFAALVLKGTCAYAQEDLSDRYAWRLDSIRINTLRTGNEGGGTEYKHVNYFYAPDSMVETNTTIYYINATEYYYRINPYCAKYVYRDFGEDGKHTTYEYSFPVTHWTSENIVDSALNISDLQKPDEATFELSQRYDYAYDTYRNIFDDEGHLIRQIRNYDYSVYRLDSAGNWLPSSRYYHAETDSTLESISYYFNTKEQKWKNQWSTYGRSKYRNHRLWIQEKVWNEGDIDSGTEYNEHGGIIRTYEGSSYNGNETYYRSGRITGKSSWAHARYNNWIDTAELITTTEIYLDDVFTRKTATSNRRDEEYLVEKTATGNKEYPQHVRSWKYSTDSVLTAYSNSVYSYDAERRCTLRLDTTLQDGTWTVKRTEYGNEGETVYSKTQEKRPAIDEWITTSEMTPEYTLTASLQWNASPITRMIDKTYRYGFGNWYRWNEAYNTESHQWECTSGLDLRVSLGENGEPLSAFEYEWKNYRWEPSYFYAFTYDTILHAYAKNVVGYMSIGADGNIYSHNYNNGNITYYDTIGNEIGWYNSEDKYGSWQVNQYDEIGRVVSHITYRINENKEFVDTTYYEQYTYFPNDMTADVARETTWYNKNADTQTWQISDIKHTKNYSSYSKEGILLYVETYGWEGDEIVLTQTMHHNDVIYDEQGRIKERITYYTANIGYNVPNMRYVYYYRNDEDPKWYGVIQWGTYDRNDETWKSQHVPEYQDYVVLDELQRVVERTTFAMNADKTALRPDTRSVYYYAGDAEDWTTADNYKWNTTKNEFYCSGVSNNAYSKRAEFDEDGNVLSLIAQGGTCERGIEDAQQWAFSYGNSLSEEPVLSPASYGMKEERVNINNRPSFSPVADRRIKQIQYVDFTNHYANSISEYHYTALREGLQEDRMPVTIEPEETSAMFTWGAVEGAETYVLHVYRDAAQAEEICYVVFDKTGKVISINFVRHAPKRYAEVEQFSYTLEGLTAGTQYWYTIVGRNAEEKAFESTHGSFRTKGTSEGTEDIDFIGEKENVDKFLRDGQIIIRRGEAEYTIQGTQIK